MIPAPHHAMQTPDVVGGSLLEDGLRPLPSAAERTIYRTPAPSLPGRISDVEVAVLWDWARLLNDHARGLVSEVEEQAAEDAAELLPSTSPAPIRFCEGG